MPTLDRMGRDAPSDRGRPHWKMIFLAAIGSGIEFYDFIIYAIFARSIAGEFFNFGTGATPLLITYSLFAISYFVRPIGGLITSYCVDRFGRRPAFLWTLAVMSGCAIVMGLLPGVGTIGPAATVAFILLRLIQSGCFGGEVGAAVTYVTEIAPRRAGTACGILFGLLGTGAIVATLVNVGLSSALPAEFVAKSGWRVAFVFGGLLGFFGYWIRGTLEESPAFASLKGHASKQPVGQLAQHHGLAVLIGFGICAGTGVGNGILLAYLPAYLVQSGGVPGPQIAVVMSIATIVQGATVAGIGWLSDRTSWIGMHRIGCVLLIVLAWPLFASLADHSVPAIILVPLFAACTGFINGSIGQISADLFPTPIRATGVTTSYNFAQAIFQGVTPLVATALIAGIGSPVSPAIWLAGVAAFSGVLGLAYPRSSGHLADAVEPARETPGPASMVSAA